MLRQTDYFIQIRAKKSNMNRVMPDLDKVFFHLPSQSVVSCFLHVACHAEKPSKILLAPVKNGCRAFYSVNHSTFARLKEKLCLIVSPSFV